MKNIYKTILVWLLTGLVGFLIFAFAVVIARIFQTGKLPANVGDFIFIAGFATLMYLALSVPAMIGYHFLAIRWYSSTANILKIRSVLAFYAFISAIVSYYIFDIFYYPVFQAMRLLLVCPYALAGLFVAQAFRYRLPSSNQDLNSVTLSSNQTL